eukprot:TRINITY_DN12591_c0_g1_i1.p1 TRINITY_DN12591_c0_g1~~TRINITY_DN12591_c0_g1_i1.p1  ORF type:complete len:376 (-),score=65.02 TRINITY_DN12591_c0_g1_i1:185-1312(-)
MAAGTPVVVDNGSGVLKAGFAGDDAPRCVIPNIIGRVRKGLRQSMCGMGNKEIYIGDEAQSMRGMLTIQHPVQHGIIRNFDDWESIMHFMFYCELRVSPEEHPVLITEPCFNPIGNREKMCQLLFETFNVPALHFDPAQVLALYSTGLTVGTVLDVGDGICQSVPIYEGHVMPHAIERLNFGGSDLNQHLQSLLKERGICFNTTAEMEQVRCMKEKLCYVASDFDEYMQRSATSSSLEKTFVCSDEQEITIGNELFRCPEALFRPSALGLEAFGVHEMVYRSIMKTDIELRRDFFYTIIPVGGSTMFPGFATRLESEIRALVPSSMRVRVDAPPERKYSAWIGGSILASLSTFQSRWVSKQQYDEEGPACANHLI